MAETACQARGTGGSHSGGLGNHADQTMQGSLLDSSSSAEGCGSPRWWSTCQVSHLQAVLEKVTWVQEPAAWGLAPPPPAECECAGESVRRVQDMCRLSACLCIFLPGPLLMLWFTFQPQGSICSLLGLLPCSSPLPNVRNLRLTVAPAVTSWFLAESARYGGGVEVRTHK